MSTTTLTLTEKLRALSNKLPLSFGYVRQSLGEYRRSATAINLLQLDIDLCLLVNYLFIYKCWRPLINWTGNHSLHETYQVVKYLLETCKAGRLEPEHFTSLEHRVFHVVRDYFPAKAETILLRNTNCRSVHDLLAQKHPHLAGFNENLLRQYFRKSFKRLVSIYLLSRKVSEALNQLPLTAQSQNKKLKELKEKLEVFAFQYLFHTAKIPLLEQPIPFHLSFLDYLWSNEPSYYRGDGGALIKLLLEHLVNTPFRFLSQARPQIELGVVTYDQFPAILENLCNKFRDQHFQYHQVARLEEIQSFLEQSKRDASLVFDVTRVLNLPDPQTCQQSFEILKAKAQEYSRSYPNILIAGAMQVEPGIGVYFLFSNGQKIEPIIDVLTNFQSAIGAYPEIVSLRRTLVQLGYPVKNLIQMYPFRDEILDDELLRGDAAKTLKELARNLPQVQTCCQKALENLPPIRELENYSKMTQLYVPFLDHFLNGLKASLSSFSLTPLQYELILQPIFKSLQDISKRIQNVKELEKLPSSSERFSRISQEFYLMIEEIIYLNNFLDIPSTVAPDKTLEEMLNSYPFAPKLGMRDTVQKQSFVFNSGMACYDAFLKSYYRSPASPRPTILFMKGCYFELTVEKTLSDFIHREFETKNYDEKLVQDCDIFCLDLYPNYAPLLEVRVNDVVSLVRKHLKPGKKLTVILDTSTTIAWNDQVARIMETFQEQIQNGTLTFVVINSLAKFSMCGFDKYPGGMTQTYCQVTGSNTNDLNQKLTIQGDKKTYSLSAEAYRFFSFFIKDNKEQIEKYIKTVNDSTDYVYQRLQPFLQREDTCLQLGVRDSQIPMMGLHFKRFINQLAQRAGKSLSDSEIDEILPNLVYFMYYFLYAQAHKRGLPLLIRPSFGFPHAAFTECWSTIRLTIGTEDNAVLDDYVRFFETINHLMSNFITQADRSEIETLLNLVAHPPRVQERKHPLGEQTESQSSPTMRKFIEHYEAEVLKCMQEGSLSACLARFMGLTKR